MSLPAPACQALAAPREERIVGWALDHWLLLLNVALTLYVGGTIAAPLLMAAGSGVIGAALFRLYSLVCHQYPWRSFFLFGQQIAFCQRDLAIYGTMLLGSLTYGMLRGRLPPLSWKLYVLASAPMALDGGTQLAGWRESTWELRVVTGFLFGLATIWTLYPVIDQKIRWIVENRDG